METVISMDSPEARHVHFKFSKRQRVRSRNDRSTIGTVEDGRHKGGYPSGWYENEYLVRVSDAVSFQAKEDDLEEVPNE